MTASLATQTTPRSCSDPIYACVDNNRRHPPVRGWDGRPNSLFSASEDSGDYFPAPVVDYEVSGGEQDDSTFAPLGEWSAAADEEDGDCLV